MNRTIISGDILGASATIWGQLMAEQLRVGGDADFSGMSAKELNMRASRLYGSATFTNSRAQKFV